MTKDDLRDSTKEEDADENDSKLKGNEHGTVYQVYQEANQKPVLILINPHSGRGKSMKIYNKQVLKTLKSCRTTHETFITTVNMRVDQYLRSKSLSELEKFRSIIVVSGDGLLYETVNSIMARQDWKQAMKIPFGVIPSGSGNGLAYTLIKMSHFPVKCHAEAVKFCCEQAIQTETCSSDLVKIRYGKDSTIWSFLSIGWGLLADIDIDSEWLRCLGEIRFTIYGLLRALTSVAYKGRLSFCVTKTLPSQVYDQLHTELLTESTSTEPIMEVEYDTEQQWIHIEDRFACLYSVHQSHVNSATNFSPKSSLTDHLTYLTYIRGKLNIYQAIEFLLAIETGSHEGLPYVRVVPVHEFKFQPLDASRVVVDGEIIPWTSSDGPISAQVVPDILKLSWCPNGQNTHI